MDFVILFCIVFILLRWAVIMWSSLHRFIRVEKLKFTPTLAVNVCDFVAKIKQFICCITVYELSILTLPLISVTHMHCLFHDQHHFMHSIKLSCYQHFHNHGIMLLLSIPVSPKHLKSINRVRQSNNNCKLINLQWSPYLVLLPTQRNERINGFLPYAIFKY